ncbi:hypothetical protein [Azospirillum argentinense]
MTCLHDATTRYFREHNKAAKPLVWTKPADAILEKFSCLPEISV